MGAQGASIQEQGNDLLQEMVVVFAQLLMSADVDAHLQG